LKNRTFFGLIGLAAAAIVASNAHADNSERADVFETLLERQPATPQIESPQQRVPAPRVAAGRRPAKSVAGKSVAGKSVAGKSVAGKAGYVKSGGYVKKGGALGYESGARNRYVDLIARHAAANGIPFALADAVIRVESRYNPSARNGGAVGLMQIKPQTARGLGYRGGAAGLHNPETNVVYGIKYLAQAYRMSKGDTCATVMRYQSGHYARRMNGANRAYCAKVRTIVATR